MVFHADPALLPGGFLGVDLFFAISGYLITRLLLSELGHTGRLDIARFYLRRVLRLLPALLVLLVAVTVGGSLIWRDELVTLRGSVLSSLGYSSNWWLIGAHQSYFAASGRPPMLQHLWSLAIEEQFYLLWPVLLVLMCSGRRRFGWVAGVAAGLAVTSTLAMAVIAIRSGVPFAADSSRVYFGTDTHAMGLLLGASLGALAERLDFQPARHWRIRGWVTDLLGLAALLGLGVTCWRVDEFSEPLYRGGFLGVSALAVLVVSTVTRPLSRLGRLLDWRALRWLGDRSYSLYLWHWPVVVVTRPGVDLPDNRLLVDALRLLLPLALATASYAYLERPMRDAGTAWLRRRSELAGHVPAAGPQPAVTTSPVVKLRRGWVRPRVVGLAGLAAVMLALLGTPGLTPAGANRPLTAAAVGTRAPSQPGSNGSGSSGSLRTDPSGSWTGAAFSAADARPHPGVQVTSGVSAPADRAVAGRASPGPASAPKPAITTFGESVMLGAQPAIAAVFPRSDVRAVEGRQPYVTLQDVRQLHSSGGLCAVVAIHTGNNGIIRASDLEQTLSQLRDRRQVILFTDRVPMDWQAPNNNTIKRVSREFSNVVVLDWYAESNGNQSWFYSDGLHLRPPGATRYASLLAATVSR
ncbi:peptidoglycan O-acetyltransferase OatA [soil metagenome]